MCLTRKLTTSMGGPIPSATSRPPALLKSRQRKGNPNLDAMPIAHAEFDSAGTTESTSSATSVPAPATTSTPKARRGSIRTRGLSLALTPHDVAIIALHGQHAQKQYDADHGVGLAHVSMLEKVEWARTNVRNLRSSAGTARSTRPVSLPSSPLRRSRRASISQVARSNRTETNA